jgi:ribonuclease BN (tRNA processing enzyme)
MKIILTSRRCTWRERRIEAAMAATAPKSLTIRTYHVGFGDCFLLSFAYANGKEKHVLVDFGSTGLPLDTESPKSRMMDIALDIEKRTKKKLHAVVATHRHKDHISGFETKKGGKGTGDVIRRLKPDLVVQPWTEDPDLGTKATGPEDKGKNTNGKQVAMLSQMQSIAALTALQTRATRYFKKDLRSQFYFLGESNIKNPSAVKNLMTMGKKREYLHAGKKTGLARVLPGVKVDVLGPPTVKQSASIKKQRARDPNEFWQLQAKAMNAAVSVAGTSAQVLFPNHVRSNGPRFPVESRWLIYHARNIRGDNLLQIVRMLDKAMNNTSVILLFRVGKSSLLFPGDAQIENWQFALDNKANQKLLAGVDVYKVGHHGSLNATPKTLWAGFQKKSKDRTDKSRLRTLMSTMEHKHGSEKTHTEVPRTTLVSALKTNSDLFSTQELTGKKFFHDTVVTFGKSPAKGKAKPAKAKAKKRTA